jgi:two-component system chemotaxis response regulator CheY
MGNVKDIASIKVVVVDDSAIMRDAVGSMLMAFGFQDIRSYANGIFSAKDIPENFADLVICDYLMEPVNGIDVLKNFRSSKNPGIANVPFILMSAFRDVQTIADAFFAKGTEFLLKPFTPETFLTRVCAALNANDKFVLTDSMDGTMPNKSFDIHQQINKLNSRAIEEKSPSAKLTPSLQHFMKAELNLTTLLASYNKIIFEEIIEMENEIDWIRRNAVERSSFDALLFRAHDIKGSALMFGNEQMGKLANELSRLLKNERRKKSTGTIGDKRLIDHVESYVAQIKVLATAYN